MSSWVRAVVGVLAAAAVLLTTACSQASLPIDIGQGPSPSASQAPLEVSGGVGRPPRLEYAKPLTVQSPEARTVWPGTGDVLERDDPVLLNLYAQDGRDGSELQNTFRTAPAAFTMSEQELGNHLYESLDHQRVGARLLLTDEQDGVPVVLVADVLPPRASGTPQDPPGPDLPQVRVDDTGKPTVHVPRDVEPPSDLVVAPLIRGGGPQVRAGQVLTVEFTAVRWSDGKAVDTTWTEDTPPQSAEIGVGRLVEGWDEGLLEQQVGSQVLLVVPPGEGFAGTGSELAAETMVYVVDILDAHRALPGNEQGSSDLKMNDLKTSEPKTSESAQKEG